MLEYGTLAEEIFSKKVIYKQQNKLPFSGLLTIKNTNKKERKKNKGKVAP